MSGFRKVLIMDDAPTDWRQSVLSDCSFEESGYTFGEDRWSAKSLVKAADDQKCRVYSIPLKHINLSANHIDGCDRPLDLADECWRVLHCNIEHPIIIGPAGGIIDGVHRVILALLMGRTHIKARRLIDMPEPDEKEKK